MTPYWAFQALWFTAGVGGTGAVWYFLSRDAYQAAVLVAVSTAGLVGTTIALHMRNDRIEFARAGIRRKNRRADHDAQPNTPAASAPATRSLSLTLPLVVGVDWVLAVFILSGHSGWFGSTLGLLAPLWACPLSYCVARFIARDSIVAGVLGGIAGGLVGAFVAHEVADWGTRYGFATGALLVGLLAIYWSAPQREMSVVGALLSALVLISSLGAFEDSSLFVNPSADAFKNGAMAVVLCIIGVIEFRLIRMVWIKSQKQRREPDSSIVDE